MEAGMLEGSYWDLAENFNTQADPALCGPASLAMALNSLSIDPGRRWKGVWRWFDQELLGCCKPTSEMKKNGVTLPELSSLAICNGVRVEQTCATASTMSLEAFRRDIIRVCQKAPTGAKSYRMIVSFSRQSLDQTGVGHFSPIAAYHPEEDKVLVMDVARFKYMPYWVSVEKLHAAMLPVDLDSGTARGYMLVAPSEEQQPAAVGVSEQQHGMQAGGRTAQARSFGTTRACLSLIGAATTNATMSAARATATAFGGSNDSTVKGDMPRLCWSKPASAFAAGVYSQMQQVAPPPAAPTAAPPPAALHNPLHGTVNAHQSCRPGWSSNDYGGTKNQQAQQQRSNQQAQQQRSNHSSESSVGSSSSSPLASHLASLIRPNSLVLKMSANITGANALPFLAEEALQSAMGTLATDALGVLGGQQVQPGVGRAGAGGAADTVHSSAQVEARAAVAASLLLGSCSPELTAACITHCSKEQAEMQGMGGSNMHSEHSMGSSTALLGGVVNGKMVGAATGSCFHSAAMTGAFSGAAMNSMAPMSWPEYFVSTLPTASLREEFVELSKQALAEERCQSLMFRAEVSKVRQLLNIHTPHNPHMGAPLQMMCAC
jgi:hypothetical protein